MVVGGVPVGTLTREHGVVQLGDLWRARGAHDEGIGAKEELVPEVGRAHAGTRRLSPPHAGKAASSHWQSTSSSQFASTSQGRGLSARTLTASGAVEPVSKSGLEPSH
jgi:hypothetical protein